MDEEGNVRNRERTEKRNNELLEGMVIEPWLLGDRRP